MYVAEVPVLRSTSELRDEAQSSVAAPDEIDAVLELKLQEAAQRRQDMYTR